MSFRQIKLDNFIAATHNATRTLNSARFPLLLQTAYTSNKMSSLEDLDNLEREQEQKKDQGRDDKKGGDDGKADGDAEMKDAEEEKAGGLDVLDEEILSSSTRDIVNRRRLLENEVRFMKSEFQRLTHEQNTMQEKIKDNTDKIQNNRYVGRSLTLEK